MQKKMIATLSLVSLVMMPLAGVAQAAAPLRVCADPGNMPLSNTKGEGFQNKIAKVIASAMGTEATFFYRPYLERGLTRQTFDNNECDILMDMSADDERMLTSMPVYRSTFVLAYRNDKGIDIKSLDDEKLLNDYKIGVFQHSAIRQVLQERGVERNNTIVRRISHNADLQPELQPSQDVQQVIDGKLDVAAIWGPMAGWYKVTKNEPLTILPLNVLEDKTQLEFDLGIGFHKNGKELKAKIEQAMLEKKDEIKKILNDYGVPLVQCEACVVSGDLPSHGAYKPRQRISSTTIKTSEPTLAQMKVEVDSAVASGLSLGEQLYNAVIANQPERLAYLISRKANVNYTDTQNQTALMLAVQNKHEDLVNQLLKAGANVNHSDIDGWTALMHAATHNEPKMIRAMSAYGLKYDAVNRDGMTAMGMAAQHGKTLALIAMLDGGANPNIAVGAAKYTPLMISAISGAQAVAQTLLQYGAKANIQNLGGVTALMIAASRNRSDMVSLLIKSGADVNLKDNEGKTAIQIARESEAENALKMLENLTQNKVSHLNNE